jgi:ABC-type amino acid transport substrate-binding protein
MRRSVILILALALLAAACSRGDDAELTTTTDNPVLITTSTTTSGGGSDGETTTTVAGTEPPEFEIIAGNTGEGEYVVLIDPGTYTEQDLRNLMVGFVDDYAPTTAHLIDSEDARDLVLLGEVTEAEQAILDAHYFARIVDGTTLEFLGPYADLEPVYIGS